MNHITVDCSSSEVYFPDDIWDIIKDYLFASKFEAISLIKMHAELPFKLSLHNYKGVDNNITYLMKHEKWVFGVLCMRQVKKTIEDTERYLLD